MSSFNQQSLKPRVLKVSILGSRRDQRILGQFLEKRQQIAHRHTAQKQPSEECLGHTVERSFAPVGAHKKEAGFTGRSLWNKGPSRHHFFPGPLSINSEPPIGISTAPTLAAELAYTKLHSPNTLWWNHPSQSHLHQSQCSGPVAPEDQPQTLPTRHLLTWKFFKVLVPVVVVRSLISQED